MNDVTQNEPEQIMICSVNGNIGRTVLDELIGQMVKNNQFRPICGLARGAPKAGAIYEESLTNHAGTATIFDSRTGKKRTASDALSRINDNGERERNYIDWNFGDPEAKAEFEKQIKKTKLFIVPGGVARKNGDDGTAPDRSDLIEDNLPMIKEMVEAAVRGGLDLRVAKILVNTNPLDEMVYYANQVARETWVEIGNDPRDLPDNIVVGMAGQLDERRVRKHLEDEIKSFAIKQGNSDLFVSSQDIKFNVFATHDDKQYFNEKSITINLDGQDLELSSFLSKSGVNSDKTQISEILKKAEEKSRSEGKKMFLALNRTTDLPAGKGSGEIAAALVWGNKENAAEITASVVHEFNGVTAASGARVNLSPDGIFVNQGWLDDAQQDQDLKEGVVSRNSVPSNVSGGLTRNSAKTELATILKDSETTIVSENTGDFSQPNNVGKIRKITVTLDDDLVGRSAEITELFAAALSGRKGNAVEAEGDKITVMVQDDIAMKSVATIAKDSGIEIKDPAKSIKR